MERPCTHGSRCPFGAGDGVRLPFKPAVSIGQSTVGLSVTSCRTDEEGRSVQGRKDLALVLASAGPTLRREGRRRRTVREPAGFPRGTTLPRLFPQEWFLREGHPGLVP